MVREKALSTDMNDKTTSSKTVRSKTACDKTAIAEAVIRTGGDQPLAPLRRTVSTTMTIVLMLCSCLTSALSGQIEIQIRRQPLGVIRMPQMATSGGDESAETLASLKTDPELESVLEKADRFCSEGQFGIAAKLWQSVLERSGDALYTNDNQIYFSLAQQIEKIIASQPIDSALSTYRITADANALEILAEAGDPYNERALQTVVRNYFLSSIGDDSALNLSCVFMDQFDFVGAFRLLEKIQQFYPDPSVSMFDVKCRMAICQGMMGELEYAKQLLAEAGQLEDSNDLILGQIERTLSSAAGEPAAAGPSTELVMPLVDASRKGVMPSLPPRYFSNQMKAVWQYRFDPKTKRVPDLMRVKPVLDLKDVQVSSTEQLMINKWRKNGWRPAGTLLFDQEDVFFKTSLDLTVWNRNAKSTEVVWRSLWQNNYEVDDYTKKNQRTTSQIRCKSKWSSVG